MFESFTYQDISSGGNFSLPLTGVTLGVFSCSAFGVRTGKKASGVTSAVTPLSSTPTVQEKLGKKLL